MKYKIEYKITNNKKGDMSFANFENAKHIYLSFIENLTIKSAKLYKIKNKKKILIEKFTKKMVLPYKEEV